MKKLKYVITLAIGDSWIFVCAHIAWCILFWSCPVLYYLCVTLNKVVPILFSFIPQRNAFSNSGRAIVKVMTMTIGELDYDEMFHQQEGGDEIAFPPASFILWIIFLVLIPVLLSNMLVSC